eukprot:evm.model.scf_1877.1 EVM.evm.TU.scf_1877.1   scf_1877:793-4459(+)
MVMQASRGAEATQWTATLLRYAADALRMVEHIPERDGERQECASRVAVEGWRLLLDARCSGRLEKFRECAGLAEQAARMLPRCPRPRFLAAKAHFQLGNHEAALATFQTALELCLEATTSQQPQGGLETDMTTYWPLPDEASISKGIAACKKRLGANSSCDSTSSCATPGLPETSDPVAVAAAFETTRASQNSEPSGKILNRTLAGHVGRPPQPYPRTPHLPFSPAVAHDDVLLEMGVASDLTSWSIVITEKLDGGNCCIHQGKVYARTHRHEATHTSFGAIKALASSSAFSSLPPHLALFGESMAAVHSIEYDRLASPLYLFAVLDCGTGVWASWEEVVDMAGRLGLPTPPVLFEGRMADLQEMRDWMEEQARLRSCVGEDSPREGFVVRRRGPFDGRQFDHCVAKYVREGHVRTDSRWRQTWKKATWSVKNGVTLSTGEAPPVLLHS